MCPTLATECLTSSLGVACIIPYIFSAGIEYRFESHGLGLKQGVHMHLIWVTLRVSIYIRVYIYTQFFDTLNTHRTHDSYPIELYFQYSPFLENHTCIHIHSTEIRTSDVHAICQWVLFPRRVGSVKTPTLTGVVREETVCWYFCTEYIKHAILYQYQHISSPRCSWISGKRHHFFFEKVI